MSELKGNKDFHDHLKQQVQYSKEAYNKEPNSISLKAWYDALSWAFSEYKAIVGNPPNETIIVLKTADGEYDDYMETVTGIYRIPVTGFNLEKEFNIYIATLYTNNGFLCVVEKQEEDYYGKFIWAKGEAKLRRTELNQLNKKFKKELTITYYVEEVLKAEKLLYTEHYT
jgi:hypothetical protein